ncbi:hypothetical protein [Halobacterium bonnevillei]|uniref:Rhomboid family intramembrane serine protease n=1 Tax=Halobacterium bonnevillei TaxID=2692200 RepID=A0A6B0SRW1_9EURY|nr:hypothetical protein [Halobacterium bonnevillei]MXR20329.1 hypothetical protein [Halobacterium bonnevillei]
MKVRCWWLLQPIGAILPAFAVVLLFYLAGDSTQTRMALNYQNPVFYQLYTAAFVHANATHLASNLFGYVISVFSLYLLFSNQNRLQEFYRAFAVIILAVPIVANAASYLTWSVALDLPIQYGRGLSAVVAAFVGLLLMNVLQAFDDELPEENAMYAASMVGIVLFASWAVMFTGPPRYVMLGMLVVVLGFATWAVSRGELSPVGLVDWAQENRQLALILLVGTFAALWLVIASFPANLQSNGGFTNLIGHGAGFFAGMAVHQIL